jgi:serine/threonine-protein kinase HipA
VREKYESEGGPDAVAVVRLLREASSSARAAGANVGRFVDGLVYNTVIAAPDAHARNYAVLLDGEEVELAPLFDVASGLAYDAPAGGSRALSMSIAGQVDPARVTQDSWKRFCEVVSVDEAVVLDKVREVAEVAPGAMAEALTEIDDWDGAVSDVSARLLPAVREHARSVLRSL